MPIQKTKRMPSQNTRKNRSRLERILWPSNTQNFAHASFGTYCCFNNGIAKSSDNDYAMLHSTVAPSHRSSSRVIATHLAAWNKNKSACVDDDESKLKGDKEPTLAAIAAPDNDDDVSISTDHSTTNDDDDHDDDDFYMLAEDHQDSISIDDESYSSEKEVSMARDEDDPTYGGGEVSDGIIRVSKADVPTIWKDDRRYQNYDPQGYRYPNDKREQLRLNGMHAVVTSIFGCLFFVPEPIVSSGGEKILDIGTGTGVWAIEMAAKYPQALITGIDLSAIQPTTMLPSNVDFLVDNAELYLTEEVNRETFDYVHCRSIGSESIRSWKTLIENIHKDLKPGGWVEFQEFSTYFTSDNKIIDKDHALRRLAAALKRACDKIGRHFDPTPNLNSWLEQQGFINIQKRIFRIPIRKAVRTSFKQLVPDITALLRGRWAEEYIQILNMELRKALRPRAQMVSVDYVVFTAQKRCAE